LPDPQTAAAVHMVKLKAPDKAKILRGVIVKIFPFTNRKQTAINTIMFLPIVDISYLAHEQPLSSHWVNTLWAVG